MSPEILQDISIALEAVIVVIALLIVVKKKRLYGLGFAITFGIYVYYDFMKMTESTSGSEHLPVLFFVATVSALFSVMSLYRRR